jgi:hypothetical protein
LFIRAIRSVSRDDDWVVKVIGCKPIGFPGVGSNPTHLKRMGLMFFFKIKSVYLNDSSNFQKKSFNVIYLGNMIKLHHRLFSVFAPDLTLSNQKNFLSIVSVLSPKTNFLFYLNNEVFFFKRHKSVFSSQPVVFIILDHDLNRTVSSLVRLSNLSFKAVNSELDFNKNIYPLLVHLASSLDKQVYYSFIKYFYFKSSELRKLNYLNNLKQFFFKFNSFTLN